MCQHHVVSEGDSSLEQKNLKNSTFYRNAFDSGGSQSIRDASVQTQHWILKRQQEEKQIKSVRMRVYVPKAWGYIWS